MKEEVKSLGGYLFAVFTAAALLNTYLYWSRFEINPFMFLGASDLLSISAPFVVQAAAIISGVYISMLMFPPKEENVDDQSSIKKVAVPIWLISIIICVAVFEYAPKLGAIWVNGIFVFFIGATAVFFKEILKLKEWNISFNNDFSRRTAAIVLVYVPIVSIYMAHYQSHNIISKNNYKFSYSTDIVALSDVDPVKNIILLGKLGETYVLASNDLKEKFFLKSSDFKVVRFMSHKKEK